MQQLVTILGPTASGKTTLAAQLAGQMEGEVISADSRQVYRGLNIGSGKDLDEYVIDGRQIPYHLVDIVDVGYEFNLFEFQQRFHQLYHQITSRGKMPVLCGGTGLYLESILMNYHLSRVPENVSLRSSLQDKTNEQLIEQLASLRSLHNTTDIKDRDRLIRALEIALFEKEQQELKLKPPVQAKVFGIYFPREMLKNRITTRLKQRMEQGMINEVEDLLASGVGADQLKFFGLEYKFLTQYILKEITYNDMFQKLNAAIHQFSKRQMTWFRKMEKKGVQIKWIDGRLRLEQKLQSVYDQLHLK